MSHLRLLLPREEASIDGYVASLPVEAILHSIQDVKMTAMVFTVLITLSVALRLYVRLGISRMFGPEDWAMVATWCCAVTQMVLTIVSCDLSTSQWKGDPSSMGLYNRISKASGALYILILIFLKVSIGYFFLHIFSHKRRQRTIIYTILIASTILGLAYIPIGAFTCATIKKLPGVTTTCPPAVQTASSAIFAVFSVVNFGGDFIFSIMACTALWEAKLPKPTKISGCLLVCLGSTGGVASLIRFAIVLKPTDPMAYTQELFQLVTWVLVEVSLGIIAANLAMIRPLFHTALKKLGIITHTGVTTGPTGASGLKSGTRRTARGTEHGEEVLLERFEVKKEVTVMVDEEKGSDSMSTEEPARPRGM